MNRETAKKTAQIWPENQPEPTSEVMKLDRNRPKGPACSRSEVAAAHELRMLETDFVAINFW